MLCISTSKWVLRTPFAGRNRLPDAKTTISITNGTFFYTFYDLKVRKKLFWNQKIDFNQQTACRAPVRWSKYTTIRVSFFIWWHQMAFIFFSVVPSVELFFEWVWAQTPLILVRWVEANNLVILLEWIIIIIIIIITTFISLK